MKKIGDILEQFEEEKTQSDGSRMSFADSELKQEKVTIDAPQWAFQIKNDTNDAALWPKRQD